MPTCTHAHTYTQIDIPHKHTTHAYVPHTCRGKQPVIKRQVNQQWMAEMSHGNYHTELNTDNSMVPSKAMALCKGVWFKSVAVIEDTG